MIIFYKKIIPCPSQGYSILELVDQGQRLKIEIKKLELGSGARCHLSAQLTTILYEFQRMLREETLTHSDMQILKTNLKVLTPFAS